MDKIEKKIAKNPLAIKRIELPMYYEEVPKTLKKCKNLEVLDLSYSDVEKLPKFLFELPKLKALRMNGCHMPSLPDNLKEHAVLTEVGVHAKKEKDLRAIWAIENLEVLTITGEIKSIPDAIGSLKRLRKLVLFGLPIKELPLVLTQLPELTSLEVNTALEKLDLEKAIAVLVQCPKLTHLKMVTQKLRLSPNIAKLKKLKKLDVSGNGLTKIPKELYDLTGLTALDLGTNSIAKIPEGIGKLKQLKVLKLNSNWGNSLDVTHLMAEIHLLQNLKVLHLWSCQSVKSIPNTINQCGQLRELDLDNNLLKEVPDALYEMNWLKKLRLTTNSLNVKTQKRLVAALPKTKVLVDGA